MTPFRLDHPWRRAGWGALAVILVSSYSRAATIPRIFTLYLL